MFVRLCQAVLASYTSLSKTSDKTNFVAELCNGWVDAGGRFFQHTPATVIVLPLPLDRILFKMVMKWMRDTTARNKHSPPLPAITSTTIKIEDVREHSKRVALALFFLQDSVATPPVSSSSSSTVSSAGTVVVSPMIPLETQGETRDDASDTRRHAADDLVLPFDPTLDSVTPATTTHKNKDLKDRTLDDNNASDGLADNVDFESSDDLAVSLGARLTEVKPNGESMVEGLVIRLLDANGQLGMAVGQNAMTHGAAIARVNGIKCGTIKRFKELRDSGSGPAFDVGMYVHPDVSLSGLSPSTVIESTTASSTQVVAEGHRSTRCDEMRRLQCPRFSGRKS